MNMPLSSHQLDSFTKKASRHTKLSNRALKKAIAKGFGYNSISEYKSFLDKGQCLWEAESIVSKCRNSMRSLSYHLGAKSSEYYDVAGYLASLLDQIHPLPHSSIQDFEIALRSCDTSLFPEEILSSTLHQGPPPTKKQVPLDVLFGAVDKKIIIAHVDEITVENINWLWHLHDTAFSLDALEIQNLVCRYLRALIDRTNELCKMIGESEEDVALTLYYLQNQNLSHDFDDALFAHALSVHIPEEKTASEMLPGFNAPSSLSKVLHWIDRKSLHKTCTLLSSWTSLKTNEWKQVIAKMSGMNKTDAFLRQLNARTTLNSIVQCKLLHSAGVLQSEANRFAKHLVSKDSPIDEWRLEMNETCDAFLPDPIHTAKRALAESITEKKGRITPDDTGLSVFEKISHEFKTDIENIEKETRRIDIPEKDRMSTLTLSELKRLDPLSRITMNVTKVDRLLDAIDFIRRNEDYDNEIKIRALQEMKKCCDHIQMMTKTYLLHGAEWRYAIDFIWAIENTEIAENPEAIAKMLSLISVTPSTRDIFSVYQTSLS